MKNIVKILLLTLCMTILPINILSAAELPIKNETDIYLKIGKYYILYTKPVSPFLDKQHRILIPLRAIEDLMGGSVSYDTKLKTATVNWLDHTFKLTINSKLAEVDGNAFKMDTVPVLNSDAMLLPLRLFLDNTNLEYKWDSELGVLHITDERVIAGKAFKNFEGNDITAGHTDAFHLKSYKLSDNMITITAKNISNQDIPEGKSDIQPLVQFLDGGFSVDAYSRPGNPDLPEVKKDQEIIVKKKIGLSGKIAYIISVGRMEP